MPMGISFEMSKTAMAGMACGLGSFFSYMIAMIILQFACGVISLILGIIGAAIALKIWKTEKRRAVPALAFSLIGITCTALTMVVWTIMFGSPI
jgi:hypothetical protein